MLIAAEMLGFTITAHRMLTSVTSFWGVKSSPRDNATPPAPCRSMPLRSYITNQQEGMLMLFLHVFSFLLLTWASEYGPLNFIWAILDILWLMHGSVVIWRSQVILWSPPISGFWKCSLTFLYSKMQEMPVTLEIEVTTKLFFPMATGRCWTLSGSKWIFLTLFTIYCWCIEGLLSLCLNLSPWKHSNRTETALWLLARRIMKSSLSAVICHSDTLLLFTVRLPLDYTQTHLFPSGADS